MPRWGDIFGGALSGAGGLMSELAMRRMQEDQQRQLQEDRLAETRSISNLERLREGLTFGQVEQLNQGLDPGLTDIQQGILGFNAITDGGQNIPTQSQAEAQARLRFPGQMSDAPEIGPPGKLQQDVQTILGAREAVAADQPQTTRDVGVRDFPVPVPGGGPPDEFDSLQAKQVFDALNRPVDDPFPIERSAIQEAERTRLTAEASATGAAQGQLDVASSTQGLVQLRNAAEAQQLGNRSDVVAQTIAAYENTVERLTRGGAVDRQRELLQGAQDVEFGAGNVERRLRSIMAELEARRGAGAPTMAQLDKAATSVAVMNQSADALLLEQSGVTLPQWFINSLVGDPAAVTSQALIGRLSQQEQEYLQALSSIITDVTFEVSGAAVAEKEVGRFAVQMAVMEGDGEDLVDAKRRRRMDLVSVMAIASGTGGREGGRALVASVISGGVPLEMIADLPLAGNPDFIKSTADGLAQAFKQRDLDIADVANIDFSGNPSLRDALIESLSQYGVSLIAPASLPGQ